MCVLRDWKDFSPQRGTVWGPDPAQGLQALHAALSTRWSSLPFHDWNPLKAGAGGISGLYPST